MFTEKKVIMIKKKQKKTIRGLQNIESILWLNWNFHGNSGEFKGPVG